MKLPQFQHSVSPSMSGAYSQPVQRAQPTMRPVVQRNTSAYLSNPRAGQRDINLEVAAVAAQAKPWIALAEGGAKIAEVFAQQEAEQQVSTATTDFRVTTEGALSSMKNMPIARETSTFNSVTGQYEASGYSGTYKTSLGSFKSLLLAEQKRLMKDMSRPAQIAFQKSNSAYITAAIREAESANRKQFLAFQQGMSHKEIKGAMTLDDVDRISQEQWQINAWDEVKFFNELETQRNQISVDHYATRIHVVNGTDPSTGKDAPMTLREIRREIQRGGLSGTGYGVSSAEQTQDRDAPNEHYQHLTSKNRQALLDAVQNKILRLEGDAKRNREDYVNDTLAQVLANPENYNEGYFQELLASRKIIGKDHKILTDAWTKARSGPLSSDPGAQIAYNMFVGDPRHSVENIANDDRLTVQDRIRFITKRREYEKGVRAWDDENNPVSNLGFKAVEKLERHFGYMPGGYISTRQKSQAESDNEAAFIEVYDRLELLMMSDEYTDAQKPKAAWDWVDAELKKLKADDAQDAPNNPYNLTKIQISKLRIFEEEHGEVDSIFEMPAGEERTGLLKELRKIGVTPTKDQLNNKTFEEWIDETGSVEGAWLNIRPFGIQVN